MDDAESKKSSLRRILLAVTVAALLIAAPFTIIETVILKRVYLFSEEFWIDLVTRFQGPGRFRFLIQPAVAIVFGIVHGRKASNHPTFLPGRRLAIWAQAVRLLAIPLLVGVFADVIFQLVLFRNVHVAPAIIIGPLFISAPYIISRWTANAIVSRRRKNAEAIS